MSTEYVINDNDLRFLVDSYRKDLYRFQLHTYKPAFLGLISQENCFDQFGFFDNLNGTRSGNFYSGIDAFITYQQKFRFLIVALIQLGDLPIYPNKDKFLELLYFGAPELKMNLAPIRFPDEQYAKIDGEVVMLSRFEIRDQAKHDSSRCSYVTRIKKGQILRFYDRELLKTDSFDDSSCYLTLSIENVTDEEFNELFKASNFLIENMSVEDPFFYKLESFLERLIKDGEAYTETHKTEGRHPKIRALGRSSDKPVLEVANEEGCVFHHYSSSTPFETIKVGDSLKIEGKDYEVIAIEIEGSQYTKVITKALV